MGASLQAAQSQSGVTLTRKLRETHLAFLAGHRSPGVLHQPFHKGHDLRVPVHGHGLFRADRQALAAADAGVPVNGRLLIGQGGRADRTDPGAFAAADAFFLLDPEAHGVLLSLAGPGRAAHAQILHRSAETGQLMALEMGEHEHAVGPCDVAGDLDRAEMFARDRHLDHVGAVQDRRQ